MEKVQVDARKLQLLNDRINQTIDALNQVRMTAQQAGIGLSHSSAQVPQQTWGHNPFQSPMQHASYIDPYAAIRQQWELASLYGRQIPTQMNQQFGAIGGLGHSSFVYDPYVRQLEIARANEANRVWELQQGLSHTSSVPFPPVGFNPLPFGHPYHVGFVPGAPVIA